jgi:hypothetical protein
LEEVKRYGAVRGVRRFVFSHGEATASDDLFDMVRILKRAGKTVSIHTNGIKIADFAYASGLKSAGIDQVSIQFDGFDDEVYLELRGERLLDIKLKALANLKKLAVPVTLNVTIARGVNEGQIRKIFDYAVKEEFIKDVSFITYCHYGAELPGVDRYMMPQELLGHIEGCSKKRIPREDVISFQKLFYAYLWFARKRKCFNYYHFLMVRTPGGCCSIGDFIDLGRAAGKIDSVRDRKLRLGRFGFLCVVCSSLKIRALSLLPRGLSVFLRGGYPKKPGLFLAVTLATVCDPYKYESAIADNCGQGIIVDGGMYDSYGKYLMAGAQGGMPQK